MKVDFNYVMKVLNNNGIDEEYFEDMGGREIEMGCVEWVDTLCEITGKNMYEEDIDEEEERRDREDEPPLGGEARHPPAGKEHRHRAKDHRREDEDAAPGRDGDDERREP